MVFYEDLDEMYCQIYRSRSLGGGCGLDARFEECLSEVHQREHVDGEQAASQFALELRRQVLEDLEAVLVPTIFRSLSFCEYEVQEHFMTAQCCHCATECWARRAGFELPGWLQGSILSTVSWIMVMVVR